MKKLLYIAILFSIISCDNYPKRIDPIKKQDQDWRTKLEEDDSSIGKIMPLIRGDKDKIVFRLLEITKNVNYKYEKGLYIISAYPTKEESNIFASIVYEITFKEKEINTLKVKYKYHDTADQDMKDRVFEYMKTRTILNF